MAFANPDPYTASGAPAAPVALPDPTSFYGTGGDNGGQPYYVPGFSTGPPPATPGPPVSSNDPGPPPAPAKTPYAIGSDPWVNLALGQYQQGNANTQAEYKLKMQALNAPYGSGGDGGVGAANLAYKTAQANADAQSQSLAHQLPQQLLQIVNQLAAHGMGMSGDANYLPGEAVYNYNTGLQGLMNDLASKKAGISIAQQQQAAQQSAQNAQHAFAVQQQTAELKQWLLEQNQGNHDTLADLLVNRMYGQMPAGGVVNDPSISMTSLGSAGIPPDILAILKSGGLS